jgi:hypothetical protein
MTTAADLRLSNNRDALTAMPSATLAVLDSVMARLALTDSPIATLAVLTAAKE